MTKGAAHEILPTPSRPISALLDTLGETLTVAQPSLRHYLAWSVAKGVVASLEDRVDVSARELSENTDLSERGAEALLGILCGVGVATRARDRFALSELGRTYLARESPYCIGDELAIPRFLPFPGAFSKHGVTLTEKLRVRWFRLRGDVRFGSARRLANQHARNLAACVAAVRTNEFAHVRTMIDVAGGSGTFSIPLALEHPQTRIVMTDLPHAVASAAPFFAAHGLDERVERRGLDAFETPWDVPRCDGVFVGNFLHAFGDEACVRVCRAAAERLEPGGKLWLHEMLWNDTKDGPLSTALWHAYFLATPGDGRQRSAAELFRILEEAGLVDPYVVPTAEPFALVAAQKRR